MIWTPPSWYLALPKQKEQRISRYTKQRFFKGPKFQRGMLHPMGMWHDPAGGSDTLTLNTLYAEDFAASGASIASIRFKTDGTIEEENFSTWAAQNSGVEWIDGFTSSVASDYEAKYDHTSGSDIPARIGFTAENTYTAITTTLTWRLVSLSGTKSSNGTAYVREIADTGNVASAAYAIYVETGGGGGCPLCCFTPDTLVTMADGMRKYIVDVQAGDLIKVRSGEEAVGEVITRTNRVMYKLTFADGRTLRMSEDHPIFVRDKGFASMNNQWDYKDLGHAAQLEEGDFVKMEDQTFNRIVHINEIDYPGTVYTFSNSRFYANGMLVY